MAGTSNSTSALAAAASAAARPRPSPSGPPATHSQVPAPAAQATSIAPPQASGTSSVAGGLSNVSNLQGLAEAFAHALQAASQTPGAAGGGAGPPAHAQNPIQGFQRVRRTQATPAPSLPPPPTPAWIRDFLSWNLVRDEPACTILAMQCLLVRTTWIRNTCSSTHCGIPWLSMIASRLIDPDDMAISTTDARWCCWCISSLWHLQCRFPMHKCSHAAHYGGGIVNPLFPDRTMSSSSSLSC